MINREKVIKGLEKLRIVSECDHRKVDGYATADLCNDTLELLKAQEPRVMTLEEVKSSVGNDMYLEISTRKDEMSYITAATLDGAGQKGVVFYCDHFDFVAYNRRLYGWRCWTSRPTYEQMEATPWAD